MSRKASFVEVTSDIIEGADQQVDVIFRIKRKEIRVTQIQIIGNQALSDEKLKSLETREESALSFLTGAGTFNNEAFERDQMRSSKCTTMKATCRR